MCSALPAATGQVPLRASHGKNVVPPFSDLAPAAAEWFRGAVFTLRLPFATSPIEELALSVDPR